MDRHICVAAATTILVPGTEKQMAKDSVRIGEVLVQLTGGEGLELYQGHDVVCT